MRNQQDRRQSSMSRYIVEKNPEVGGSSIPEDEPCIVIRGQDILAIPMLKLYIEFYKVSDHVDYMVIKELYEHLGRLNAWQEYNAGIIKWADR